MSRSMMPAALVAATLLLPAPAAALAGRGAHAGGPRPWTVTRHHGLRLRVRRTLSVAADPFARAAAASGGAGVGVAVSPAPRPAAGFGRHPTVPGSVAVVRHGIAYAPENAPVAVQRAIWAANAIRTKPYLYGGGHGGFADSGYDCSGSVSYLLHGGGLLAAPLDSNAFAAWGDAGAGSWITVYTNPSHAFVEIAGIRLDTSAAGDPGGAGGSGPRWRPLLADTSGFEARHLPGL